MSNTYWEDRCGHYAGDSQDDQTVSRRPPGSAPRKNPGMSWSMLEPDDQMVSECRYDEARCVEWREGISPSRSPRTVRETLASYGSSCPLPGGKFTRAFGSSHYWLTKVPFGTCQPLRSIPITGTSTLLRVGPPLCSASVLSFSWFPPLEFLP